MAHAVNRPFPLGPLLGAGAMVFFSIVVAGTVRLIGTPSSVDETGTKIASEDMRFTDQKDGSVAVFDAKSGAQINRLAPGTNGFIRATLRGLARERKLEDQGSSVPFRLTAWANGRLTLDDLSTGRHVELEAFGPTNAGAFASLLRRTNP